MTTEAYLADQVNLNFVNTFVSEMLQLDSEPMEHEHPRTFQARRRNSLRNNILLINGWLSLDDTEKEIIVLHIQATLRRRIKSIITNCTKDVLMEKLESNADTINLYL